MVKLFIKRTEIHHTEEYITSALESLGNVSVVSFIPKSNAQGAKYNAALVTIDLNYNDECKAFMTKLEENNNEPIKFSHHVKWFWWIGKHKTLEKPILVEAASDEKMAWETDTSLSPEAIKYLNEMKAMLNKAQMENEEMKKRVIKAERTAMQAEHDRTQEWLHAKHRESEIFFKDVEIEHLNEELTELKLKNCSLE